MNRIASKTIIVLLIFTNILTAVFFISGKKEAKVSEIVMAGGELQNKPQSSYLDNSQYVEKMSLYSVYGKKGRIVMLGNSITARVDWAELLNRDDIINRGIGSDVTEGFLSRMEYIYSVNPEVCYIMGGVNDIARKIPQEETIQNIIKITEELRKNNIKPVIQSVLYVADSYPNYIEFNQKIESMNNELEKTAIKLNVKYLDINVVLSSDKLLIKENVLKDGIHLNGTGYGKWKKILIADLKIHGL